MQSSRQISPCHRHGTAPYLQQQTYVELLRGLFKEEQSKDFVKLAYITGILPIKKYGSESALNNFYEFTMTNPQMLAQYIGFTEREVSALCGEYGMDFPEAAWWYDGYSFRRMKHVYNPNSVVRAMLSGEYDNYWTRTAAYESLKDYICMDFDGLKETVVQVLAGGQCKVDISGFENDMTSFRHRDDVLTALIHLGYLGWLEIYIPNEEARGTFATVIRDTDWTPVISAVQASDVLLRATWDRDAAAVAKGINEVHRANTSILEYNNENSISCVITLAYYNAVVSISLLKSRLISEREITMTHWGSHLRDGMKTRMIIPLSSCLARSHGLA